METVPWVAPDLEQIGRPETRAPQGSLRFPQAIAFVWKVDAGKVNKIQDIVVYC
jgi:hypothetical protein